MSSRRTQNARLVDADDAMKQYLDDLRWQNRELELTIAGRENLIAQEKAEAQVREEAATDEA